MAFPWPSVRRKCEPSAPALCQRILPCLIQAIRLEKVRNAIKKRTFDVNRRRIAARFHDAAQEHRHKADIALFENWRCLAGPPVSLVNKSLNRNVGSIGFNRVSAAVWYCSPKKITKKPNILVINPVMDIKIHTLATNKSNCC